MFPDGAYIAFAGDAYSRVAQRIDGRPLARVLHALPGDGQNRPSVAYTRSCRSRSVTTYCPTCRPRSTPSTAFRQSTPIPRSSTSTRSQTKSPATCRAFSGTRPTGPTARSRIFQPAPATVLPDMLRHQQDLIGPVAHFRPGLRYPRSLAAAWKIRKQPPVTRYPRSGHGQASLVWRRTKQFYADVMLLERGLLPQEPPRRCRNPTPGLPTVPSTPAPSASPTWKGNIAVHPGSRRNLPAPEIPATRRPATNVRDQRPSNPESRSNPPT